MKNLRVFVLLGYLCLLMIVLSIWLALIQAALLPGGE